MKRFTETTRWSDPWFRRLSVPTKLLWCYLTDNCNSIGLIDLDLEAASFHIGTDIEISHLTELGDRVQRLKDGKIFIPKFIPFQYGELSETCPAHKPVLKLVRLHQITPSQIGYQYPSDRVSLGIQIPTGKEKEKEKEEGVQGETFKLEPHALFTSKPSEVIKFLNETSGRKFRETESNISFIKARLSEPGVTMDGVKAMIVRQWKRWAGTSMEEYIRPETLFNKTKFDGYYAAKDQPINENNNSNTAQRVDRSIGTANEGIASQYAGLPNRGFGTVAENKNAQRPAN